MNYMRILLPTDFSENAWHSINYATYLFEQTACRFYVLHSHQVSPSALISTINKERDTRLHEITEDEAMFKLHKLVGTLEKLNKVKDHSFEAVLSLEPLINAVGRNVIDLDIDYICMGTQGASGLKEIFLGSNTVKIIKHIDFCPIIAVPQDFSFASPDKIAFATDYHHLYQKIELEPLLALANLWSSLVLVVHMDTGEPLDSEQKKLKKLLKGLLGNIAITFEEIEYHPTTSYKINYWVKEQGANMLVMFNSVHGFFRRLLTEPIIKKVAFKSHVPFLVLPMAK